MDHKEYNQIKNQLLEHCQKIMNAKQPEYTNNNLDVLYNFKSTANRLKLTPQEVWAVFLDKQVQSIITHAGNPNMLEAEPIESRYADAINYLFLGFALYIEHMKEKHEDLNLIYRSIE
tara:strand:+ start:1406 stop:1759 length:354 start_codon:yes stop_codon:yes gene_type:complete